MRSTYRSVRSARLWLKSPKPWITMVATTSLAETTNSIHRLAVSDPPRTRFSRAAVR
ncbi:hypothetical protein [Aurantiacibacter suaedae]|uniref:hypothetical protein n=1 Tax=Aurantiacibacter suaedae TaxID=2545755 RepID=UPI0013866D06|nr:hypothetical protein [Aurantiacibacter suaedae]